MIAGQLRCLVRRGGRNAAPIAQGQAGASRLAAEQARKVGLLLVEWNQIEVELRQAISNQNVGDAALLQLRNIFREVYR